MRFFDIRPGEAYRVGVLASLLFFLVAANNLIKILRDSIFLGHHSVTELPYLYILVAIIASAIIATSTRFTTNLSPTRLIVTTNAIILSNIVFFWFLLTYFDPGWSHYAFYIWSAMVSVIAVAQLWTLANQIFTPDEGKRLFGFLAAGGTLGGAAAGFGAKWALELSLATDHLLWLVAALFLAASALVLWAGRGLRREPPEREWKKLRTSVDESASDDDVATLLSGSAYLKTIAVLILVSVIVSTLIDFQLKGAAQQAYSSKETLAGFFSSYYAWLSLATFLAQAVLTRHALSRLGLIPSLYLTPGVLLTGLLAIMVWPGLLAAALTRMADATLRNSIHRTSVEIIYMAVPDGVRKRVKTFLDVVVERIGDATAGFIILFYSLFSTRSSITYAHFICVGLIIAWILLISVLRIGYGTRRKKTESHEVRVRPRWQASNRSTQVLEDERN